MMKYFPGNFIPQIHQSLAMFLCKSYKNVDKIEFVSDLSGFQGLVHAIKLGEDSSAGSIRFPWSHRPGLISCDRPTEPS